MPNFPDFYRNIKQIYKDTKSNIENLSGVTSGSIAYATDTNELGYYNNSKWIWTSNSSSADAIIRANSSGKLNLNWLPDTLTGKDADTLDGQHGNYYTDAENILWGDTRLSSWMSFIPNYTIRDHFTTSTMSSYWDGWAADDDVFAGAPGYWVTYNYYGHWLYGMATPSQANKICYLYKSGTTLPTRIQTQLGVDSNNVNGGLMIWESNTKYIQLYIKAGVGTYSSYDAALFKKTVNGGTTTETQISSTFPGGGVFKLYIYLSGTTCYGYATPSYIHASYTTGITLPSNFAPTRWGIFIMTRSTTGNRLAQFNYFTTYP
ncbi:MAG: hypothetical protein ACUVT3_13410 [Ignavibacterium sp.]